MKVWYDRRVWQRIFKIGDKVLVLLPIPGHALQARYCGPYLIEKKLNEVDYVVYMPERQKQRRVCHINMLKEYYEDGLSHSVSDGPLTVATTVTITHETRPKEKSEGPTDEGFVGADVRLKNSDVLANLDNKLSHLSVEERDEVTKLIQEFIHLFPDTPKRTTAVMHDVDVGSASPCKQHPYRVNPLKLLHLQKEIDYMLENDLIEPSNSNWSSPCLLVPKPDGSYRFCTDFRKLNAVTKNDSFPIPRIDDCIDKIGHAKFVSKLDLLKGYWQVPLTEQAKKLSAFVTPTGLYQYQVMPFGMKNAPATFQRLINQLTQDLEGCEGYIDDIVIYSKTWQQHMERIHSLFSRLTQANLTVNLTKSEFGHAHITFLGHIVGQGQVTPVMAKDEAVTRFPVPKNKRELMRFLGMAGYYRKFYWNFSIVTAPLTNLLRKQAPYLWVPICQEAFDRVKAILLSAPVLAAPNFDKQFKLCRCK